MIADAIRFVLSNFVLTFFVIGLIAAAIDLARRPRPLNRPQIAERALAWFLFWSIGVSMTYNFVMHSIFGAEAARFIGWADSPFQYEVGVASLGFALVGFLGFRGDAGIRLAAVLGWSVFLLGAAVGHIIQIVKVHNFAPGNAGIMLYADVLLPLFGFVMLRLSRPTIDRP